MRTHNTKYNNNMFSKYFKCRRQLTYERITVECFKSGTQRKFYEIILKPEPTVWVLRSLVGFLRETRFVETKQIRQIDS